MKRLGLVLVPLLLLSSTTGCQKLKDKLQKKDTETTTSGEVSATSSGGTVSTGGGASLPADWPSNVPVYPGAKITAALSSPNGKTVTFETSDDASKVHDFYKSKISGKLQADVDLGGSGSGKTMTFQDGKRNVAITIMGASPARVTLSVAGG